MTYKTETFWSKELSETMTISARETEQGILVVFDTKIPCITIAPDGTVLAHFKKETAAELCNLIHHVLTSGNPKDDKK